MITRLAPALISLVLGVAAVAMFTDAAPAWAQKDPRAEAKAHYASGKKLYDQGQYELAIAEFRAADQLAPSGVNDFNIALAHEALGNGRDAIRHYESYLTRVPDAPNRATVEASIKRLDAQVRAADEEARRLAEEEAARRAAEEAARRAEVPADDRDAVAPPGQPTGDPDLDRVAAIDVNEVRDQRYAATAGAGGGAAPPPFEPEPAAPKKAKPIYKQWWFWVVAGVSAYVLITILAADSSDQPQRLESPMPTPGAGGTGGMTLWRF
jgi:tetratricopeptide (TPR) repeat protein